MGNSLLSYPFFVSFLFFQTLAIIYTAYGNPSTVTNELIHKICIRARNRTLCSATLDSLKGKELNHKPLLTLGGKPLNMSLTQAQKTDTTISYLYESIKSRTQILVELRLKLRYYKCHVIYSDIKRKLALARISIKGDHRKEVKDYASAAMIQATACEDAFKSQPPETSSVPQEVEKLMDNLSILLAVCEYLK